MPGVIKHNISFLEPVQYVNKLRNWQYYIFILWLGNSNGVNEDCFSQSKCTTLIKVKKHHQTVL